MASNRYVVGCASTSRAACKFRGCGEKIEKGALRMGKIHPNPFHQGETVVDWYHPLCLFLSFSHARAKTKVIESVDDVEGYPELPPHHQHTIDLLIEENRAVALESGTSHTKKREAPLDASPERKTCEGTTTTTTTTSTTTPTEVISTPITSTKTPETTPVTTPIPTTPPPTPTTTTTTTAAKKTEEKKPPLKGLIFSIIGRFSVGHKQLGEMIQNAGGTISTSVTRAVTHLVASPGEETTTKYKKAITRGVPIISEKMLNQIIAGELPPPPPAEGAKRKKMKREE